MFNRFRRRRLLRVFKSGDWQSITPAGVDPRVAEIGFHKARAAAEFVPEALREESRQWLIERGYKELGALRIIQGGK